MIATKHKVFCSFAFTGEDEATLNQRMQLIVQAFKDVGVEAYCNLFDARVDEFTAPKQFMDAALEEINTCDIVFVVMASDRRSEGMLVEVGAAYALGKKIVLARHQSANGKTYLDKLADKTIDWETNEDLQHLVKDLVA